MRSLSGKAAMGGGMKLEKELVSGLSWWAVVQDTALQALSFPSRVTIPPCHPHPPLSCPHTPSSPVVHRAPSPKQWQGAWCNNPAHRPPKSAPADHLVVRAVGGSGEHVRWYGLGITLAIPLTGLHLHLSKSAQTPTPTSQSILPPKMFCKHRRPASQLADVVVTVE